MGKLDSKTPLGGKRTVFTTLQGRLSEMNADLVVQPLHNQVRQRVLQDLCRADLAPGDLYCTENTLADRLNVSRTTVRKAMDTLEQEGYVKRRRRVGVIVGSQTPLSRISKTLKPQGLQSKARQQVIFVFPRWDDSVEGFYSGRVLRELSSPTLSPSLSVEVRHADDALELSDDMTQAIVAVDPDPRHLLRLGDLARRGVRIILLEPAQVTEGVVGIISDGCSLVSDAVKRFYSMGHRAVGLVNHDQSHLNFRLTFNGFVDAHRELDLPIHPRAIVQADQDLETRRPPAVQDISAWVCTYLGAVDLLARECHRLGLSIPQDVSILSLDDPGDAPWAAVGKRLSVARPDFAAHAAMIHKCLHNWRREQIGAVLRLPSIWVDGETLASPPPSHRVN